MNNFYVAQGYHWITYIFYSWVTSDLMSIHLLSPLNPHPGRGGTRAHPSYLRVKVGYNLGK